MKEDAEFYRIGLLMGLLTISVVIEWCDSVIMAEASPDIAIIEASILGSRGINAVAAALSEVKGEVDRPLITKRIFRSMYDLVNHDREKAAWVARRLFHMALDGDAPCREAESEMSYFDDAFDLAKDGYGAIYGEVEGLTQEMLRFLKEYSVLKQA